MPRVLVSILLAGASLGLAAVSSGSISDIERTKLGGGWRAPASKESAPASMESSVQGQPLLALLMLPSTPVVLQRVDPLSLERLSEHVLVGEYHGARSLSPDRSQLALGISSGVSLVSPSRRLQRRIGVIVVDLETMKIVQEVETGIAAQALGWLGSRSLVAALQRGGTVLVDPVASKIIRRWPAFSFPDASARTPNSLVLLFGGNQLLAGLRVAPLDTITPRLAVAEAQGRFRSVSLERIRLAVRPRLYSADQAGLAVDPSRARAYVFAAGAPAAIVDLRTMRISYHPLPAEPGSASGTQLFARSRRALWLGHGKVMVFGHDFLLRGGRSRPAGLVLVDTGSWKTDLIDPTADGAVFVKGMLLAYGSRGAARDGLRIYTVGGSRIATLLNGERVVDVQVASSWAYVRTPRAVYVLDVVSKRIVNKIVPPVELVDVIVGS